MVIKGYSRIIDFSEPGAENDLVSRGVQILQAASRRPFHYHGNIWSISAVEPDLLTKSARFQLFIGGERSGKFSDPDGRHISEAHVVEYEDLSIYAMFDIGFLLLQHPVLRTRTHTPKQLVVLATSFLEHMFAQSGFGTLKLQTPHKVRNRSWFIKRLLEVAQDPDSRITEVRVTHLHDSQLSNELTIFNPDYDLEQIGKVFMPKANRGISESIHKAEQGNDLAKNPLVRAQVGAGHPERMVIKIAPDQGRKRERKTTYDAHDGELMNVAIAGRRPRLPEILEMLRDEFRINYGK